MNPTALLALVLFQSRPETIPPPTTAVVDGTEAAECEWPSVVAMLRDDGMGGLRLRCSGTLIHPQVVMTAAHCIMPGYDMVAVGFGERAPLGDEPTGGDPARVVSIDECAMMDEAQPPGSANTGHYDFAFCRLSEAVDDVPIVPLISPCELDAVQVGAEVTLVGFGATSAQLVDNVLTTVGAGTKRWTTMTVENIDADDWHRVNTVNLTGSTTCNGDSGGPSFIRLADGSWRVYGATSGEYTPDDGPPPPPDNMCWAGSSTGFAGLYTGWLEQASGFDLTACHDAEGTWDPSPSCAGFPTQPNLAHGTWADGCAAGEVIDPAPSCEAAGGSSSGGSDGGTATSSGGADESTGAATEGSGATTASGESSGGAGSSSEGSSGAPADGDGGGCGCRSDGRPHAAVLVPVVLLLGWRRRPRR